MNSATGMEQSEHFRSDSTHWLTSPGTLTVSLEKSSLLVMQCAVKKELLDELTLLQRYTDIGEDANELEEISRRFSSNCSVHSGWSTNTLVNTSKQHPMLSVEVG